MIFSVKEFLSVAAVDIGTVIVIPNRTNKLMLYLILPKQQT
jgi:hypothetical protein